MVIYNSGNTLLPNDQKVVLREVSKAQRSQNSLVTYRDAPTNDNFNKLYDKESPVRKNLFFMDSVNEIAIIKKSLEK